MSFDPSRLQAILLNTGLQISNQPLYQLLRDLINTVAAINTQTTNIISGGGTNVTNILIQMLQGLLEGNDGEDAIIIPGPIGIRGIQGIPGLNGIDGEDFSSDYPIPFSLGKIAFIKENNLGITFRTADGDAVFLINSPQYANNNIPLVIKGIGATCCYFETGGAGATCKIILATPTFGGDSWQWGTGIVSVSDFGFNNITRSIIPLIALGGAGADSGNIGISVNVPTALLHIGAGIATAKKSPLKFTSGVVLTSPEAGAVEFTTDTFFFTITTGAARKGIVLDDGARLTSGKIPVATTNGRLIDSTASLQVAAGIPSIVASTFEKAETGSDANVLTYTSGASDEFLVVHVAADVSAITGTSVVVTVTWKDSNNATATSTLTLTSVTDGTIHIPINVHTATNVVVSTVFVGVSTAYNISAFLTRMK